MKNSVLFQTIRVAVKTCPWDCLTMTVIQIITSLMPTVVLLSNRLLIQSLSEMQGLVSSVLLLFLYCFCLIFQRFLVNWYNHYYLTYNSLLRFEKRIKIVLFDICGKMKLHDYNDPEIVNATLRAKNASINILRVYQAIGEIFSALIGALSMGFILSSINRTMAVIIILLVVSAIGDNLFTIFENKKFLYQNTQLEKEEENYADLLLKPKSLKEIRSLNRVQYVFDKWLGAIKIQNKSETKKNRKIFFLSLIITVLSLSGQILAYMVLFDSFSRRQIGIAEFSISTVAFNSITGLIKNMFDVLGGMGQFLVMVKPFFDFQDLIAKQKSAQGHTPPIENNIHFEHVSYRYPGMDRNALSDINIEIKSGQKVAIVGENGSGKTTLLHLILDMFEPTKGTVFFGKIPYHCFSEEEFLKTVSVVPQEFNCYAISINDNISFGHSDPEIELKSWLTTMHLSAFQSMQNAIVGREFGGIELSGGQRQRLAILRAKYKRAGIFVFDEPTSAIDPFQESETYKQLKEMMNGKTAIVVSHRLALTKDCDKIIVLQKGRVAEMGTHDELLHSNGLYAHMWKAQAEWYS